MEKESIYITDGTENAGLSLHTLHRGLERRPLECRPLKYRQYNKRQSGEKLPGSSFHVCCMANNIKNSILIVERTGILYILNPVYLQLENLVICNLCMRHRKIRDRCVVYNVQLYHK